MTSREGLARPDYYEGKTFYDGISEDGILVCRIFIVKAICKFAIMGKLRE